MPAVLTLVVGSGGQLGARLVAALRAGGASVATASRSSAADWKLDVNDRLAARELLLRLRPAVVVHLAGVATSPGLLGGGDDAFLVNSVGFANAFGAATDAGCARVVLASSASVYGQPSTRRALTELDSLVPESAYGRSKVAAERVCADAPAGAPQSIVFRFPPVYAPDWIRNLRVRAYVPGLERRVLLNFVGDQPAYSLCDVSNAVDAIRAAVDDRLASGVYNVADARAYAHDEVRGVVSALDGVTRAVSIPVGAARGAGEMFGRLLPGALGRALRENVRKLASGLVLDTSKLAAAGVSPSRALGDLLAGKS
ncbi:MAG TPA: NAD(P)-dependent oxidoreductase [Gemmatimonadaceae bacterium]|nr:NAD(P)-dependent oxidoreductase [Gemmatimonadaceae bacterium]